MKWIVWISLLLFPAASFAETYTLIPDSHCSNRGEKLEFSCKANPSFSGAELSISQNDGIWYGREKLKKLKGFEKNEFRISLLKHNESVMVFDYPVMYSGIANIVLIKKTGRYYFSEIAYSELLNAQEATIEAGRFTISK
jgi:hypothetical protein